MYYRIKCVGVPKLSVLSGLPSPLYLPRCISHHGCHLCHLVNKHLAGEPLITFSSSFSSCLPETRNKTLTEIHQLFSKQTKIEQKSSVAA